MFRVGVRVVARRERFSAFLTAHSPDSIARVASPGYKKARPPLVEGRVRRLSDRGATSVRFVQHVSGGARRGASSLADRACRSPAGGAEPLGRDAGPPDAGRRA